MGQFTSLIARDARASTGEGHACFACAGSAILAAPNPGSIDPSIRRRQRFSRGLQTLELIVLLDLEHLVQGSAHSVPELVKLLEGHLEANRRKTWWWSVARHFRDWRESGTHLEGLGAAVARFHLHQQVRFQHFSRLARRERDVHPPPG